MTSINVSSSLIWKLEYDHDLSILTIYFIKYYTDKLEYYCTREEFNNFVSDEGSIGKYYLNNIKNKLKIKNMAETKNKPKGINKSSDKKRFIKMRLNVAALNKDWFFVGETGKVYADLTLHLLPDGEVDNYENLGMVTQDVPKEVYTKDKTVKGPILGNGKENEWHGSDADSAVPASETADDKWKDDLPF